MLAQTCAMQIGSLHTSLAMTITSTGVSIAWCHDTFKRQDKTNDNLRV